MRLHQSLLFFLIVAFVISTTSARAAYVARDEYPTTHSLSSERYFRTELYFGLGRKNRGDVTSEEWSKFLAVEVTPRFPDGLTVVEASGQFRDASGVIIREPSRMLILLYKKKDRESAGRKIDEIRVAYCKQFDQESVLRVDIRKSVEVAF